MRAHTIYLGVSHYYLESYQKVGLRLHLWGACRGKKG
uniref:Uncharacterized protein n=1 Tax=Lepeophtheirus salmonis TaxID=72036 RepID=A0A0K2U7H4_LEPSM